MDIAEENKLLHLRLYEITEAALDLVNPRPRSKKTDNKMWCELHRAMVNALELLDQYSDEEDAEIFEMIKKERENKGV